MHGPAYILLVLAAGACTLAAIFYPRSAPSPWYNIHVGWLGIAFYMWSLVITH